MVKDYKEIVLNYIENHNIPSSLWLDLRHGLCKCKLNDDVYELISRLNYKYTINNCSVRGYENHYIPRYIADEIVCGDILKELNKVKSH